MATHKRKPLWRCPKCGARFVTRNMWHSCVRVAVRTAFARSEPHVYRLFQKYVRMARRCGPLTVIPQKTRIVFLVRVRYAGCVPRKSFLLCNVALPKRVKHPRFLRVISYGARWHAHQFVIRKPEELDAEIQRWLCDSYRMGQQAHLGSGF